MRTVRNLVVVLLVMIAGPLSAQAKWPEPKCDLKPGHFLVNSGLLYLKSAHEARYPDQKTKDLRDAQRVLTQALTTGGQILLLTSRHRHPLAIFPNQPWEFKRATKTRDKNSRLRK